MKLAIVMDPIERIKIEKDSSFAMLLAAQQRELSLYYMEPKDLFMDHGTACGQCKTLRVKDDAKAWFELGTPQSVALSEFDIILMRQDPPVTTEYYVATYILENAQRQGVLVVNDPRSLRDVNEKVFCTWFPDVMSPTLVSKDPFTLMNFIQLHQDVIVKPLHNMGGISIFRIQSGDGNTGSILESVTAHYSEFIMAQKYIPQIKQGDKRILLIDGKPIDYALARIPKPGEIRGNLAVGGTGKAIPLSDNDRIICDTVSKTLTDKGLLFVGLDVIGDYLTEINVTSPTCIRELDKACNLDIAGDFIDCVMKKVHH